MNNWTRKIMAAWLMCGLAAIPALAQSLTDKNPPSTAQVEIRANQAFNRGEYATALPLFQKLADTFKDQPARLGSLQEKIRVCEKAIEVAKKEKAAAAPVAPAAEAEQRKPHVKPKPGDLLDLQIKDLGNFEYDQEHGGNIPKDVLGLTGSKIRLHGFMIPMDQAENITQFALVPSLFACCFGQPPQIQHTIVANCPKGKAVGYVPDEIVVEGILKVQEKKDDGYVVSIFEMEITSVKPAPK
ncbi:MAG TPA: DUF3299 domain-containing protein [Humisphaera sp.]|nr:DUF3299 domain-containing protein [Humisphaera sp.]